MKINNKGFSLVEAIVVVIIISVIVLIWGFYGRDHVRLAMMNEGYMFIEKIIAQEKIYRAERSSFWIPSAKVEKSETLSIDTLHNKYFKKFKVEQNKDKELLIIEVYGKPDEGTKNVMIRGLYNITDKNNKIVYQDFFDYSE